MAAPLAFRQQQRLQAMLVNQALNRRVSAIRAQGAVRRRKTSFQAGRTQPGVVRERIPREVHLMGKPPASGRPPSAPGFQSFPGGSQQPFQPFTFQPFQNTPFTQFQFQPFPFTQFTFTQFPAQQQQNQTAKLIGSIGKVFAKLPLKALKLTKLLKPKAKLGRGGGLKLLRRRRGGRFRPFRLLGLGRRGGGVRNRRRGGGARVPFTPFRIPAFRRGLRKRGRPKGGRNVRRRGRRVTRRRPATLRQQLQRKRWGKAGRRAQTLAAARNRRLRRRP